MALAISNLFAPFSILSVWPVNGEAPALAELTLAKLDGLAAQRQVHTASGHRLRFVRAEPKPRRGRKKSPVMTYEKRIYTTGEVPTRADNWHDAFNALIWCVFPRAKAALNERQYHAAQYATPADLMRNQVRTREQDRLAMFDEGGAIFVHHTDDPQVGKQVDGLGIVFGHAVHECYQFGGTDDHLRLLTYEIREGAGFFSLPWQAQLAVLDERIAAHVRSGGFREGLDLRAQTLAKILASGET